MKSYSKSSKKVNLAGLSEIEIYNLVRNGVLGRFPKNFFDCEEAKEYCPKIVRYMIEDIMGWKERDEVPKKIRKDTFSQNKLAGMLNALYRCSPSEAVIAAYPERRYMPWEFHETPNSFWRGENGRINGIEATRWLFDDKLNWDEDDIREKISWQVFTENGLLGMVKRCFNNSIWECIDTTYPRLFQRFEIGEHVPNDYWNIERGNQAVRWLIEKRLRWTEEDVMNKLDKQVFIDNDLYGMIQRCFSSSPYIAINSAYPGVYNAWDLRRVPMRYWNLENSAAAAKWLVEEKLHWSDDDIREKLSGSTFKDNGFVMLAEKFTPYELMQKAYPERNYMPWELKASTPFGFWDGSTSIEAVRWLVEMKLKISPLDARYLTRDTFKKYGIIGALDWYKGSVRDFTDFIYKPNN